MPREETDRRPLVPDLSSDRIAYLAFKALFDPRSLTSAEVQELAASVVAHRTGRDARQSH